MDIGIEPGICISERSGFRHADTMPVTDTGCRALPHKPRTGWKV